MTNKYGPVTHLEEIRRRYRPEFKLEAVRQFELNKKPPKELAFELGINYCLLYAWRRKKLEGKLRPQAEGPRIPDLQELRYLRQTVRRLTRERDLLKKAISYFTSPDR